MSEDLQGKHCIPCEGGVPALTIAEANKYLQQLANDWQLTEDGKKISKCFAFKGYYKTIAFVNAIAWIAQAEGHHPDLEVSYNRCVVNITTHAVDGLTENDFILASKIESLKP